MQTNRLVELALKGLEAERARIDQEIAELRTRADAFTNVGATVAKRRLMRGLRRQTRRLTPAGRKRLSDMMKARWAERRRAAGKK
jgi:hypothetical protein